MYQFKKVRSLKGESTKTTMTMIALSGLLLKNTNNSSVNKTTR